MAKIAKGTDRKGKAVPVNVGTSKTVAKTKGRDADNRAPNGGANLKPGTKGNVGAQPLRVAAGAGAKAILPAPGRKEGAADAAAAAARSGPAQDAVKLVPPAAAVTAQTSVAHPSARPDSMPKSAAPGISAPAIAPVVPARPVETLDPRLPAIGTVLVKLDRGSRERASCAVEEGGYRYRGTLYPSLSGAASAAAKELGVSTSVNGFVFWGLAAKPVRPVADLAERLRKLAARYEDLVTALVNAEGQPLASGANRVEIENHLKQVTALLARAAA